MTLMLLLRRLREKVLERAVRSRFIPILFPAIVLSAKILFDALFTEIPISWPVVVVALIRLLFESTARPVVAFPRTTRLFTVIPSAERVRPASDAFSETSTGGFAVSSPPNTRVRSMTRFP